MKHQLQLKPHQLRVVVEKAELDMRLYALRQFIGGEVFNGLDSAEQERLRKQEACMVALSDVLLERIEAFEA